MERLGRPPLSEEDYKNSLIERTERNVVVDWDTGCWLWSMGAYRNGYGRIRVRVNGVRKTCVAHRVYYELYRGEIPKELELDHLCRNRICVNPWHLEAVPHAINSRRALGIWPHSNRTHCKRGHPYTPENLTNYRGRNGCRACMNERSRSAYRNRLTGKRSG